MNKLFKSALLLIGSIVAGAFVTNCSNMDESNAMNEASQDLQVATRNVGVKTPKLTTYIETNDINPLNAGEYLFTGTSEEVVDHVILFASNIRGTASTVQLYHNPNQTYILANRATLIVPLQNKGIKVMLGLLGDWTGVGFANMTPTQIESFAQQVATCVTNNNLDGVDFDDEYADYANAPAGLPNQSATIFGNLIQRVRQLLPRNKLITVFHYGGNTNFNQATMDVIDYMWPNFGCSSNPPAGLPNSKWAKLSVNYSPLSPSQPAIQNCANNYAGYGAVMTFNLRDWNCSTIMNYFASRVWGAGKTVTHTGIIHPKNY